MKAAAFMYLRNELVLDCASNNAVLQLLIESKQSTFKLEPEQQKVTKAIQEVEEPQCKPEKQKERAKKIQATR